MNRYSLCLPGGLPGDLVTAYRLESFYEAPMKIQERQGRNHLYFSFFMRLSFKFLHKSWNHMWLKIRLLLQKEYQNDVWSLDVAHAAQEDTSIVHSLVPLEPGGQVGRSFLNVGRSGWAEGPEYPHDISTSPLEFSDLSTALLSRAHIPNAESAPLTKRTKNI